MNNHPAWLIEASRHIGKAEIPGVNSNPWVVSLWKAIKRGGIKDDATPWCAAFVGACLENVGIVSSRFESAKSYLDWGIAQSTPCVGSIVVFTRDGGGHVGFVVGKTAGGALLVLGGNQGNEVNVRSFPLDRVSGYRWPAAVPMNTDPLPIGSALATVGEA